MKGKRGPLFTYNVLSQIRLSLTTSRYTEVKTYKKMSVCLAITKGIAVSSIGLYSGLLASASLITSTTPLEVLTGSLTPTLTTLKNAATALGALRQLSFV